MSCPPRSGRSTACPAAGDRSAQRLPEGGASRGSAGLSAEEMESGELFRSPPPVWMVFASRSFMAICRIRSPGGGG